MPAPTPCGHFGCYEVATNRGMCPEHQREPWAGSTRKERLPDDWNTRVLIVMRRDKGICHLCGNPGADSVDHIEAGDNHDLDNLAPAHMNVAPYCHRAKSSAEGNAAKASNRIRRRL